MSDMPDAASSAMPGGHQSASSQGGEAPRHQISDRVLGLGCLALGFWYVFETRNFVITAFGSGPVGPKTLPTLVGILFGAFALFLILKPDESPHWASLTIWWRVAVVVATSFLFGQLLEPMGFIIASTVMAVIIGVFFRGPILKLVPLSFVFSVLIAFIFNNWLELRLPAGWWGGF
jgi:putative tricarboxylic transport membrane protein